MNVLFTVTLAQPAKWRRVTVLRHAYVDLFLPITLSLILICPENK